MVSESPSGEVTGLLAAVRDGDATAADRLAVLIYQELRKLARRGRAARRSDTLSTTALVHEAYLRLFGSTGTNFPDRHHFYAYAAQAMRRIVVDNCRREQAAKRGAGVDHRSLDESGIAISATPDQIVALDQVLQQLHDRDSNLARLVELRVFGGLTVDELACQLGISTSTVKRNWRRARALLSVQLAVERTPHEPAP